MLKQLMIKSTLVALVCGVSFTAHAVADPRPIDIPAGDLVQALESLSRQAAVELVYQPEQLRAFHTQGVRGLYEAEDAVRILLKGTPLELRTDPSGAMLIAPPHTLSSQEHGQSKDVSSSEKEGKSSSSGGFRLAQATPGQTQGNVSVDKPDEQDSRRKRVELEEVLVTGTYVRGGKAPIGSPLNVYSRDDIEKSGAATLDQFARQMPENFASIDASNFLYGSYSNSTGFDQTGKNQYEGAGFNLHGLGPGATLTLIDGHRFAPAGGNGAFVDTSLIPLAAIERIEVLPEGASAIYGADAVAGVVNIILRRNFDGAQSSLRYGGTTRRGAGEFTASQLLGKSWGGGNAMLIYEHDKQNGLVTTDRDFIPADLFPTQIGRTLVLPEQKRDSVFLVAHQDLSQYTTLSGDGYYSDRRFISDDVVAGTFPVHATGGSKTYGGTLTLGQALPADWHAEMTVNYSKLTQPSETVSPSFSTPGALAYGTLDTPTQLAEADLRASGSLASLPGGAAKLAVGAEFRHEKFAYTSTYIDAGVPSPSTSSDLARNVRGLYAEVLVPLLGESNASRWARRLELSLAARNDRYNDFGSSTNPKVGLLWSPAAGVAFRGSYGTSFQVPLLDQLSSPYANQGLVLDLANPASPNGVTTTLELQSPSNPALQPERAHTYSLGFDISPATGMRGFTLSGTYFHIEFRDRIANPPVSPVGGYDVWYQTQTLAPFLNTNPSLAQVQALFAGGQIFDFSGPPPKGPAGVQAIFDARITNIAATTESGIELSSGYDLPVRFGSLNFGLSGDYLLKDDYRAVFTTPSVSLKNQLGGPLGLRLHGVAGWSYGSFASSLSLNYWDKYQNPIFTPSQSIASWTTLNLQLSYRTSNAPRLSALHDLTVAFSVQNLADRNPPHISTPPGLVTFGFDTANSDPLGRALALQVTKDWRGR